MTRQNLRYGLYGLLAFWAIYVFIPPLQQAVSSTYKDAATGLHDLYRLYADGITPFLIWISAYRAVVAAILILILLGLLVWSISVGLRQSKIREKDEVFGDPERTKGGWYWMICGLASLALVWFYFSQSLSPFFSKTKRRKSHRCQKLAVTKLYSIR